VTWKDDRRECTVALEDGHLVLDGLLWPHNRLLWKDDMMFDAESWPFEVVFESPADGSDGRLSIRAAR
jgi:hypothetical protein